MRITTIGIDLAKNIFHFHGVDKNGRVVLKKKLGRNKVLEFMANTPPCLVGIEACGGSHYWARELVKLGHDVKMISPQFVKPYVKTNKNDHADAEAICEAVSRPSMRFVPVKQVEQQDILSIHRVRQRLIKQRIALSNQVRGLLHEYGVVIALGNASLRKKLPELVSPENEDLTPMSKALFRSLLDEFYELETKIEQQEQRLKEYYKLDSRCALLTTIPGVGLITVTSMVASIGSGKEFENGRQLSAWLGLVPKQHSTGGKERLLGISKRGDKYLRSLLVHGARAVFYATKRKSHKETGLTRWIKQLDKRRGPNKTVVAIANKIARAIWAILNTGELYRAETM